MPTTLNIPASMRHFCTPCEFLDRENTFCDRAHGITGDYICHHPEAFQWPPVPADFKEAELLARLRGKMEKNGRMIGRTEDQPSWCPLLRDYQCPDCEGRGSFWKTWNQDAPEPACCMCDGTGRVKTKPAEEDES
jgi:hypothetical protein